MKRTEINAAIQEMTEFAAALHFRLPPFAFWTPEDWKDRGPAFDEIRRAGLGWDVTDFGKGAFARCGLTLFTVRNGCYGVSSSKPYCEKVMMVKEQQVTPMHFHWKKTEDIINRGGGDLVCQLFVADPSEQPSDDAVSVSIDGAQRTVPAGTEITLHPGESITLTPYVYHAFWGAPGRGRVLVGEVSTVNDDAHDNRFLEELPRFPGIEEDGAPIRLLCTEYPDPT